VENFSPARVSVRWRSSYSHASLRRTFSRSGFSAADIQREPVRYRIVSLGAIGQAVPHGHWCGDQTLYPGRCQRTKRLANLCRVRTTADHASSETLCRIGSRAGPDEHGFCAGLHHHGSLPVAVFMAAISQHQGGGKDAYAVGPSRQYRGIHTYFRRQGARCQRARSDDSETCGDLYNGSRISRFRAALHPSRRRRFFCHSRQSEFRLVTDLFSAKRPGARDHLRSDGGPVGVLQSKELPPLSTPHSLQRSGYRGNTHPSDQPIWSSTTVHLRTIQSPVASRVVLQMDQENLRIKKFCGTSENAVKVQIWTAVSVYVLVSIIKKRLNLDPSLYTLLQVCSVTFFEKTLLNKALFDIKNILEDDIIF
jgi:hypothetical protein